MSRRGRRKDKLTEVLPTLRRVLLRFAPYLPEHRALLAGSVLALLITSLVRLLEPWPLKFILDRVVSGSPTSSGYPAIDALSPMTLLTVCTVGFLAVVGLKAFFQYLATVGFALVGNRVLTAVRNDLFRHLQSLSLAFHKRARTGDLIMRLIGDVGMLKETVVTAALPLATNVLVLAGMLVVMLVLDWQLTLLALMPLPLLWFNSIRIGHRIRDVSRKQRKREGEMAATAAETMAGMPTVQALAIEDRAANTFLGASSNDLREGVKAKRLQAKLEQQVDLLTGIALAIVLWFGTTQVLRGRLTPGDLIVFISYLKNTLRPVREYARYTSRLAKATAAGERVVALLDEIPTVRDLPGAVAESLRGEVTFERTTFRYGDDSGPTLDDVSLTIQAGSCVAIVGPSGVGKSTLASLILRLYDPTDGRVLIDGQDVRAFTLRSLRAQISLVPQETLIFRSTLAENIALGAGRPVTEAEIEAAARLANIHDFIATLPQGYTTEVAERGATLSAGQRQRIAIARAALRRTPILILDEPTVGLDRANRSLVIEALRRLAEGRTTILITHELDLVQRADRIIFLEDGRVTDDGCHSELIARGGPYAALWQLRHLPHKLLEPAREREHHAVAG